MGSVDDYVSAEFQRLAEVINDYDPYLFLEMVPVAEHANLIDKKKVFRIVDDRYKKIVMYADSLANPRDILERLFLMDQQHGDPVAILDAHNAAVEALNNEKRRQEMDAVKEFVTFIAKNTKSRWEHDGKIYDDEFRNLGPKTTVID